MIKADFNDSDHWIELAKGLHYDLPDWKQPSTVQAMQLWLDRFDLTEAEYEEQTNTTLEEFIELNPAWPLRAFVGLLLEDRSE